MPVRPEQLDYVQGVDAVPHADASRRWELDRDLTRRGQVLRVGLLMLAIAIAQAVLYGSSLIGSTVILSLGTLAQPHVYYAPDATTEAVKAHDYALTDLIFFMEPERKFVVSELQSSRLPLWTPFRFGGAPCWPLGLSPPWWPAYLVSSPVVLAWVQMLVAQTAGLGAYLFIRRVLRISYWPAMIAACCYPLSGAYIVWTGFWLPAVMCWLPWMFLAVAATVWRPCGFGGPCLAAVTGFSLIGGAADIAGQVLLASGFFAIWCLMHRFGRKLLQKQALVSAGALALAWLLGFCASAWLILPLFEYTATGARMIGRSHGAEARPPMGLIELPEFLLPNVYGSTRIGSYRLIPNAYPESAVAGYVGMITALVAAPLAFWSRRHRSINLFWVILIFVTSSWMLNVPGMVQLLRLPGLNMMSHNRFVFVTGFAILALAATGLQLLWEGTRFNARKLFGAPIAITVVLLVWSLYRVFAIPEPIKSQMSEAISRGAMTAEVRTQEDVARVKENFIRRRLDGAAFALVCLAAWGAIASMSSPSRWLTSAIGATMVMNLLWFGYGRAPQFAHSMYGRGVPLLDQIAAGQAGRIIGFDCLPANLAQLAGLRDIRGYDGIDPARMVDLLKAAGMPNALRLEHAITQWLTPLVLRLPDGTCRISPILDMLNVRYIIFRGTPFPQIRYDFIQPDYWAVINHNALPRTFVPSTVVTLASDEARLAAISSLDFDPRQIAYIEQPVDLPSKCEGLAEIVSEIPTKIVVTANMKTPGLLVLADLWDVGWRASLVDGAELKILRTNHAIRGVVLPAGQSVVQFTYSPASFRTGLELTAIACFLLVAWTFVAIRGHRNLICDSDLPPKIATGSLE